MAWKKAPEELTALHADLVARFLCDKKKMFGCQVFFVNDNMFTGVYEDGIMIRLPFEDKKAILSAQDEVAPFMPMGREMKEYIFIHGSLLDKPEFLEEVKSWIEKSYAFVSSMPPKAKKAKAK